ncbi:MAG: hypothetical protein K6F86_11590 [Lachnospiraceae bacterium]|nr:hypothetical protein [Lachnospiraceae bacterium]
MNELIDKIEECISQLLRYDTNSFGEQAQYVVNLMITILPSIINCYSDPRMSDVREDAVYWPAQLERIIKALENDDSFEITDILYNETRINLMELRDTIVKRGLA